MSILPLIAILLLTGAVLLVVGTIVGGARLSAKEDALDQVRGRLLMATGVVAVLLVACAALNGSVPGLLGLPLALSPALAAAGGVLTFGALPWRSPRRTGERTASLRHRSAADVTGPRALLPAALVLAVLLLAVVAGGITAAGDRRSFTAESLRFSSTAGPYPGWFYGGPLLAAVLLLAAATLLAIRRAALLPAVHADAEQDLRWRRGVGRAVLAICTSVLLLELAGLGWTAGWSLQHVAGAMEMNGQQADPLLAALAPAILAGGVLSGLLGLALLAFAVVQASALGRRTAVPAPA